MTCWKFVFFLFWWIRFYFCAIFNRNWFFDTRTLQIRSGSFYIPLFLKVLNKKISPIATNLNFLCPFVSAEVNALLSAQIVAPYEAFSWLAEKNHYRISQIKLFVTHRQWWLPHSRTPPQLPLWSCCTCWNFENELLKKQKITFTSMRIASLRSPYPQWIFRNRWGWLSTRSFLINLKFI